MKNKFFKSIIFLSLFIFSQHISAQEKKPKNILFIIVDDLRPELPNYGKKHIIAPNIEKLSKSSVQFNNAFCNIPVCGASRASLLTGFRPNKTRFVNYFSRIDEEMPNAKTLSGLLKDNGYTTISNGKVSHNSADMKHTWSEVWDPPQEVTWRNYKLEENIENEKLKKEVPAYEAAEVDDDAYFDGQIATKTISDLIKLKDDGKPFLLFSGLVKPHLPFNAPKKYWDLYDPTEIKFPINKDFPSTAPKRAQKWYELTAYKDITKNVDVEEELAKKLIHGYYACVSYIDAQIGRILTALDELGLAENTIVILTSDHGFSLSEHNRWSKHSLFKTELQVPLIIKVPGLTKSSQSDSFAELVDLYPTICELLNIKGPKNLQGNSLVENLIDPNKITKTFAFSRYINGDSYMSDNFFYSEWKYNIGDKILDRMIYENHLDPLQMNNLSHLESYNVLMDSLGKKIDNQIINNK